MAQLRKVAFTPVQYHCTKPPQTQQMSLYLALIGTRDNPLYEMEIKMDPIRDFCPFIVHSALDIIEDLQWKTNQLYFKNIDNYDNYSISGYVTPGNIKFMILYQNLRSDEAIRQFFGELNDLYVKTLLSPFYTINEAIRSKAFDQKVRMLSRKYFNL